MKKTCSTMTTPDNTISKRQKLYKNTSHTAELESRNLYRGTSPAISPYYSANHDSGPWA